MDNNAMLSGNRTLLSDNNTLLLDNKTVLSDNKMVLLDNNAMLLDIHRNVVAGQDGTDSRNQSVSAIFDCPPNEDIDGLLDSS